MDDAIRTVQRLVFGEAALYGGVLRRLLRDGGRIVTFCRRLRRTAGEQQNSFRGNTRLINRSGQGR